MAPRPIVKMADPPVTVSPRRAAAILGVSRDWFDEQVLPEVRHIRRGRMVLVPIRELERWSERNAAMWASSRVS